MCSCTRSYLCTCATRQGSNELRRWMDGSSDILCPPPPPSAPRPPDPLPQVLCVKYIAPESLPFFFPTPSTLLPLPGISLPAASPSPPRSLHRQPPPFPRPLPRWQPHPQPHSQPHPLTTAAPTAHRLPQSSHQRSRQTRQVHASLPSSFTCELASLDASMRAQTPPSLPSSASTTRSHLTSRLASTVRPTRSPPAVRPHRRQPVSDNHTCHLPLATSPHRLERLCN